MGVSFTGHIDWAVSVGPGRAGRNGAGGDPFTSQMLMTIAREWCGLDRQTGRGALVRLSLLPWRHCWKVSLPGRHVKQIRALTKLVPTAARL